LTNKHILFYSIQHPKYEYLQWYFPYFIFKALLINEGETTRGERESGQTRIGAKRPGTIVFQYKRKSWCFD